MPFSVSVVVTTNRERKMDRHIDEISVQPRCLKTCANYCKLREKNKPYQTCKDDIASGDRSKWSSRSRVVMSLEVLPRFVVHPGGVFYKNLERPS